MIKSHIEKKNGVWVVSDSCRGKMRINLGRIGQRSFLMGKAQQYCNKMNCAEVRDGIVYLGSVCD